MIIILECKRRMRYIHVNPSNIDLFIVKQIFVLAHKSNKDYIHT